MTKKPRRTNPTARADETPGPIGTVDLTKAKLAAALSSLNEAISQHVGTILDAALSGLDSRQLRQLAYLARYPVVHDVPELSKMICARLAACATEEANSLSAATDRVSGAVGPRSQPGALYSAIRGTRL